MTDVFLFLDYFAPLIILCAICYLPVRCLLYLSQSMLVDSETEREKAKQQQPPVYLPPAPPPEPGRRDGS